MAKTPAKGGLAMRGIRIRLAPQTRKGLARLLGEAEQRGDWRTAKRVMALRAVADGDLSAQMASLLQVSDEAIRLWVNACV